MKLTVTQVRLSLLKRSFRFIFRADRHVDLVRIGSDYGGWWVPSNGFGADPVIYLAGVGTDISFDLGLITRFDAPVLAMDPTPRSLTWLGRQKLPPGFHFEPVALAGQDGILRLYPPRNEKHVSYSITNFAGTGDYVDVAAKSLPTLMRERGHDHISLLKMDIEGAQHSVIDSFARYAIYPLVVCVEMDQPEPVARSRRSVRQMRRCGYSLVKVESFNLTFVHRSWAQATVRH